MSKEPEQMLIEQDVSAFGRIENCVPTVRSSSSMLLESITAGMAKITMNDNTSFSQRIIGMRLSDMPGARCFRIVAARHTAVASAEVSVKVIICAQKSTRFPGEKSGPESVT